VKQTAPRDTDEVRNDMKKLSSLKQLTPLREKRSIQDIDNLYRVLFGRAGNPRALSLLVRLSKTFDQVSPVIGKDGKIDFDALFREGESVMEEFGLSGKILDAFKSGDAQFFRDIADYVEAFAPMLRKGVFPVVSPAYFSALSFFTKKDGRPFTRDELAEWIEKETGKRLPNSTITDILKRFGMKPRDRRVKGKWSTL
jgi:hypothetical protein